MSLLIAPGSETRGQYLIDQAMRTVEGRFPGFHVADLEEALPQLRTMVDMHLKSPGERLVVDLLEDLAQRLNDLAIRSLITVFHASDRNGVSPSYREFDDRLREHATRSQIMAQLPELERLIKLAKRQWVQHCSHVLRAVAQDHAALEKAWGITGDPVSIRLGQGDHHCGGRSVAIVTWSSGRRTVLKPSWHGVESVVRDLLTELDPEGQHFGPVFPDSLERDGHAWQKFVSPSVFTHAQARDYLNRYGRLSALMFAVGATDLHRENVIATSEGPVLVDTETLTSMSPSSLNDQDSAHQALGKYAEQGILRTMMYPARYLGSRIGVELSALGIPSEAARTVEGFEITGQGSDEIRFAATRIELEDTAHQLFTDSDQQIDPRAFLDDILTGFRYGFDLLRNRPEALRKILQARGGFGFRQVLRATWVYARFLEASTHPSRLQGSTARSRTLDSLPRGDHGLGEKAAADLLRAEVQALHELDIPYFEITGSGAILANGRPGVIVQTHRTPAAMMTEWWQRVLDGDLNEYVRVIRLAVEAAVDDAWMHAPGRTVCSDLRKPPPRIPEILSGDGRAGTWLTSVQVENGLYLTPFSASLYESGGALLSEWETSDVRGSELDDRVSRVLRGATFHILPTLEPDESTSEVIYSPWTGALSDAVVEMEFSHRGVATEGRAPDQLTAAVNCLPELLDLLGTSHTGEWLNGTGGLMGALNRFRQVLAPSMLTNVQLRHLVQSMGAVLDRLPLVLNASESGLAHGNVGRLLGLTECVDFLRWYSGSVPDGAEDHLVHALGQAVSSWQDEASFKDSVTRRTWCRGAAGLAPAVLRVMRLMGRGQAETHDILAPIIEPLVTGGDEFQEDLSICHGAAGPILALVSIARATGQQDLLGAAHRRAHHFLQRAENEGWSSGLGRSPGAEGFMVGRAGWDLAYAALGSPTVTIPRLMGV